MRAVRRGVALASVIAALVMVVGCPANVSDDPYIAMTQEWAATCGQLKQGVQTATSLNLIGALSETEASIMDKVNVVYVGVCSVDPQPVASILTDIAVKAAVGELCPELKLGDDLAVTIATATVCAARQYLLLQLEGSA